MTRPEAPAIPPRAGDYLDRLIGGVVRRRWWVMTCYLLLALALLPGALTLRQDNAPEVFFVRDAEALEIYADFEFEFGRDRTLRVILEGPAVWRPEGLAWLAEFERRAPGLRGVIGAASLFGHHAFRHPEWPPGDPGSFRAEVLADPLDRHAGWVNGDGSAVSILVALYKLSPAQQRTALAQIRQSLADLPDGMRASVVGLPVVNEAMDQALEDMVRSFFPLLLLLATLLLLACLRQWNQVLILLGFVAACLVVPLGLMGYQDVTFNLVIVILVPLLFVIALATATHVLLYFRRHRRHGLPATAAVRETYRVKAWPVIWTGITTGVGFGSLMISAVPPIRALGFWSVLAIGFMTVAMLTLYPAVLSLLERGHGAAGYERWAGRSGERWAAWSVRRPGWVIALFAAAALGLAAGLPRLAVESNVLTYFAPDHPMRAELQHVQDSGIGVLGAELLLVSPAATAPAGPGGAGRFDAPGALARLLALGRDIRAQDLVLGGISAGDLVQGIARYRTTEPQSPPAVTETLEYMRGVPEHQRMLAYFLADDARQARISVLVPMLGFSDLDAVFAETMRLARQHFPAAQVRITGQYPLVLAAQKTLLRTMLLSLSLTLLCIVVIFRWALGSVQLMLRALVPNLWPVVFVLGAMGWWGLPVDSTTVMIAAAVLGLAVDDTLHALGSFRYLTSRASITRAAITTLRRTAPAHVLTSLVLALGFATISLSEFVPVARFGGLTALAILAALLADLLLVPALLAASPAPAVGRFMTGSGPRPDSGDAA